MTEEKGSGGRVIRGTLFRRHRARVELLAQAPSAIPVAHRPANVAQMLALAHHLQRALDRGVVRTGGELARRLSFTPGRISELFDLLLLAPDIQEAVLGLQAVDGKEPTSERALHAVARQASWAEQRKRWAAMDVPARRP